MDSLSKPQEIVMGRVAWRVAVCVGHRVTQDLATEQQQQVFF